MLILIFVVSFGPKKGTLLTYTNYWYMSYNNNLKLLLNSWSKNDINQWFLFLKIRYRYQYTIITSRLTVYVLFTFWCFFFFFGEFLLLLTFNYNNLTDLIPSNFFNMFKTHTVFLLDNSSGHLNNIIFFYIIFFTTCSLNFLLNLRYSFNYNYFKHQYLIDLFFLLVNVYLFNLYITIFFIYIFWFLNKNLINKMSNTFTVK
jgi:hypothetical protein